MLAVPGTTSLACVISLTQAYFLRIIHKKVVLPAISKIDHTNQSANGRLGLETSPIHCQPASHNPPRIRSDSGLSILTFTFNISELNQ